VFDTIATESQRLLNGNFSMFVRNFLPRNLQPDASTQAAPVTRLWIAGSNAVISCVPIPSAGDGDNTVQ
jgi:hypothetical protein